MNLDHNIELDGERVKLIPLHQKHVNDLFEIGKSKIIWTYLSFKCETIDDMLELVNRALRAKDNGSEYPFVVLDKELNKVVGSTRFLNISAENRNLEIGWTWYSPEVWSTRVNTECKYLLLRYCFETLHTVRVQFKADVRNDRSNKAIERIGAVKEGMLRNDRIYSDGYIRNAYIHSIIDQEWPLVKEKLEQKLLNGR